MNATVLHVIINDEYLEETAQFFEQQKHYFKNLTAKRLNIKYIPDIIFKLDKSIEYSTKKSSSIKDIDVNIYS